MGQGQSSQETPQNRAPTPEPADPVEAKRLREEDRARRAAAAEQRLAALQKKKPTTTSGGSATATPSAAPKKKETALEQMSRENKGWRDADQQADLRAWN